MNSSTKSLHPLNNNSIVKKLLVHTRRPDITFYRNGRILITARVANALGIRPGSAINIIMEGRDSSCQRAHSGACSDCAERSRRCNHVEYLLCAHHYDAPIGRFVAQCYPSKRGGNNFRANSVTLCRALMQAVGITTNKVSYMVGEVFEHNGRFHLPIIIKCPL